jgi:hypothetical protein
MAMPAQQTIFLGGSSVKANAIAWIPGTATIPATVSKTAIEPPIPTQP